MSTIRNKLGLVVILLAALLFLDGTFSYKGTNHLTNPDSERNERSTPRAFVLPATPAVAYQQEAREESSVELQRQIGNCVQRLDMEGYFVGDEIVDFNARLKVALYEFQIEVGLRADGNLTKETKEKLGC